MNAIELSERELKRIHHNVLSELENYMSKNSMNVEKFISKKGKLNEKLIERNIKDIIYKVNNFINDKKYIQMSVKMNKQKFEILSKKWYVVSNKELFDLINNKIIKKKEQEKLMQRNKIKPVAQVKPRMGTPTIVLD